MESGRQRARRAQAVRGFAAASVAVVVSSAAHTLSGGGPPPAWLLVAIALLAAPVAVALVGRRRHLVGLGAAVVLAQGLLHVAFATVGTTAPLTHSGEHVHTAAIPLAATSPHGIHAASGMYFGHLVAAVVTIVLLAHGERMLVAVGRGILLLLSHVPAVCAGPRRLRPRAAPVHDAPHPTLPPFSLTRRGPPALAR